MDQGFGVDLLEAEADSLLVAVNHLAVDAERQVPGIAVEVDGGAGRIVEVAGEKDGPSVQEPLAISGRNLRPRRGRAVDLGVAGQRDEYGAEQRNEHGLYLYLQAISIYLVMPITPAIVFGILSRRVNFTGAAASVLGGLAISALYMSDAFLTTFVGPDAGLSMELRVLGPFGVLASGRGSNLQSVMDSIDAGKLKAEIVVVISDKKASYALERARKKGIAAEFIDPKPIRRSDDYDAKILATLKKHKVDLVLLAGFMRVLKSNFLRAFPQRILNIHPSLLPAFPGP